MDFPFPKSERLVFRRFTIDDVAYMHACMNTYDAAKMTGSVPFPFTLADAKERVETRYKPGNTNYNFIITLNDGEALGDISLFKRPEEPSHKDWEIGYAILPKFYGMGLATEAVSTMTQWGITHLKTNIRAGVFHDNPASMRVLEKVGYKKSPEMSNSFSIAREMVEGNGVCAGYDFIFKNNRHTD